MRNLKDAMELAGKCLLAWLDPEKEFMPTGGYEVAHDTGRWWDAMLRLEDAAGFVIPKEIEDAMLQNIQKLMNNPYGMLLNNPTIEWLKEKACINPHNFREGLLALTALVRYRNSAWAVEKGHRLLETINTFMGSDGRFDLTQLGPDLGIPYTDDPCHDHPPGQTWFDGTGSSGRSLEAVIWFYEATGDPLALHVAERIAQHHFFNTVKLDGSIQPNIIAHNNIGHNHSYLGTLRGLLLYGFLTGRNEYVEAVAATYKNSIWKNNISWSGWTPHDLGRIRFPDEVGDPVGEHASCGDVAQIALWLALRAGHTELLDDVGRLVRARLLPSQIIDKTNPRAHGAWGVYGHPFGQGSILDVFAAVLHTLTDIYQHVVTKPEEGTVKVNLHFEISTPWADVSVKREDKGYLRVILKEQAELYIRVPGWATQKDLKLTRSGKTIPFIWEGQYLLIRTSDVPIGGVVELQYELPVYETAEVMPVSRRKFRLTWRGDEVVACSPKVPIYPET